MPVRTHASVRVCTCECFTTRKSNGKTLRGAKQVKNLGITMHQGERIEGKTDDNYGFPKAFHNAIVQE